MEGRNIGGRPVPLPEGFIDELKSRCVGHGLTQINKDLSQGQTVRITNGPFTEFMGEVERVGPKDRVRLLIDLLNGQISVETKIEHVLS